MTESLILPETNVLPDAETCPICGAVLHLAGEKHLVWDMRIGRVMDGTETFETYDDDPMTRLPDGILLKASSGRWLSVGEVRDLLEELGPQRPLEPVVEAYGHDLIPLIPSLDLEVEEEDVPVHYEPVLNPGDGKVYWKPVLPGRPK